MTASVVDQHHGDRPRTGSDRSLLDRGVAISTLSWATLLAVGAVGAAILFRLAGLDVWALGAEEAQRAHDAWLLYEGRPSLPGERLPETAPLLLLLQSLSFFLFGTSDVTARLAPSLVGLGVVLLALALRPYVGRAAALGMATLAAFSPSLVFASRTATPEILVASLTLLVLVALLAVGRADAAGNASHRRAGLLGFALAALFASGPSAISAMLGLGIGVTIAAAGEPTGAARRGLVAIARRSASLGTFLAVFVATVLVLFTRLFSDLGAIAGVGRTLADWGTLLAERSVGTPTQFFLLALLLYEPLALMLAAVAALRGRAGRGGGLGWPLFGAWFVANLVLWSFSSGREPIHAVHVALPLVLLGGGVLGDLLAATDRRDLVGGTGGALSLALLGLLIGLISAVILIGRVDGAADSRTAAVQAAVVATLVVVPLVYLVFVMVGRERATGRAHQPLVLTLLVLALLLGGLTLRSSILLNFYRADEGTELLAQRTPTEAIEPVVARLERLSRDTTLLQGSVRDTPGGHGLSIAADRTVRWPFQWYFRDFPEFAVVDAGQAALADADVTISPGDAGLPEAGFTPRTYPWLNRVPPSYADLDASAIFSTLVRPDRWVDGARFLLYREGIEAAAPETIALGLDAELSARVFPSSGPFSLTDRPGPGSGRGQFNQPVGVAVADDGTTYVVDQGNARVQRFDREGNFVGSWGGDRGEVAFARTDNGLGPTGIAVAPDGLIYVADTWNHRIVVLSPTGEQVREIGAPVDANGARAAADTTDDPAAVDLQPSAFFGPRGVAVTDEEIFVVDTGNERVQVFAIDGMFRRVWGGYGSEPERLIEPVGIAIGPDGRVYVADSGNARVSVFTPDGAPVDQWPIADWPAPDPSGARPAFQPYLALDEAGRLYVSSAETGRVVVLDERGQTVRSLEAIDGEDFARPVGVALGPADDLFVTDMERDVVYRDAPPEPPPVAIVRPAPPAEPRPEDPGPGGVPTSAPLPRPPG